MEGKHGSEQESRNKRGELIWLGRGRKSRKKTTKKLWRNNIRQGTSGGGWRKTKGCGHNSSTRTGMVEERVEEGGGRGRGRWRKKLVYRGRYYKG